MKHLKRSRTQTEAGTVTVLLTVVLAASFLLPLPGSDGHIEHLPSICPFYALTGLPCPGCGLTRAFICLGHGHWRDSLHWHPLGWLVYAVFAWLWIRNGLFWWQGVALWSPPPPTLTRLGWCAAGLLLATGAVRIGWLTAHHLRF